MKDLQEITEKTKHRTKADFIDSIMLYKKCPCDLCKKEIEKCKKRYEIQFGVPFGDCL